MTARIAFPRIVKSYPLLFAAGFSALAAFSATPPKVDGFWAIHQTNANGQRYYGDLYFNQVGWDITGQADWGNHAPGMVRGKVTEDSIVFIVDHGGGLIGNYTALFDSTKSKLVKGVTINQRDHDTGVWNADKSARPELGSGFFSKITLGSKVFYGKPGETLWAPIYLNNFGTLPLSACKFTLRYDSTKVRLLEVAIDSGMGASWAAQWGMTAPDMASISLGGLINPIAYGGGDIVRCKFLIKASAKEGEYSDLTLDSVRMDGRDEFPLKTTKGRIVAGRPDRICGDVDGNGGVDVGDLDKFILYLLGLLSGKDGLSLDFAKDIMDLSGNGQITSHDAALILQHAFGLLPVFPVQSKPIGPLPKTSAGPPAELKFSGAISVGDGISELAVTGSNVQGLVSGEFALGLSQGLTFISVSSALKGARVSGHAEGGVLKLVLATNDGVESENAELFRIRVRNTGDAVFISFRSAYLNEGRITGTFDSKPLNDASTGTLTQAISHRGLADVALAGKVLRMRTAGGMPMSVQVFDPQGRLMAAPWKALEGRDYAVDVSSLKPGPHFYRIRLREEGWMEGMFIAL